MAGKSPLGFIGLGTMGGVMASRLVEAGHALVVYDTSAPAVQSLADKGAVPAESPAAVASAAEIVFASLPTPDVVRAVATGDKGVIAGDKVRILVDLSTTGPRVSGEVAAALAKKNIVLVDAPVSGGRGGAIKGTLAVMAAAPREAFDAVAPYLAVFGKVIHVGEKAGLAQTMKLVNNLMSVAALAITAVHLSRISEELVMWSTSEFGFVEMSDAFTTGSSMMPQKKNPDMAELVRGKTGRVIGDLVSLCVMLKGLPLAYNRDMQEDKPPVFDAFDTVDASLQVLAGCIDDAHFDAERMRGALREGFVEATELADFLVRKGVPFREAHHVVGGLVARAVERGVALGALTEDELKAAHPTLGADALQALDIEAALARRQAPGSPSREQAQTRIEALKARLQARLAASEGRP